MKNYYEVLGISQSATQDEIQSRYRFLAKVFHPDRFTDGEAKQQAENEMKQINEAYTVLSNPYKREAYNQKIGGTSGQGPSQKGYSGDEYDQKKVDELIVYLSRVEQKWRHLANPFPKNEELERMKRIYQNGIFMLIEKAYPGTPIERIGPTIEQSGTLLAYMMVLNICLGVEKRLSGLPSQYNETELSFITFLPIYNLVRSLVKLAQQKGRTTDTEGKETIENFSQLCNLICLVCFEDISAAVAPNNKQSVKSRPTTESGINPSSASSVSNVHGLKVENGVCQNCFQFGPVENVTFHRVIGIIVFWLYRKVEGKLCYNCAEQFYWKYTGVTTLFGWWSFGSLIATPIFLLINFFNYRKAGKLRESSHTPSDGIVGWKAATFTVLGLIVFYIMMVLIGNGNNSYPTADSSSNSANSYSASEGSVSQKAKTSRSSISTATKASPRPTPTPNCKLWNKVTAADKGKIVCVYGTVKKAYFGDTTFYITFGDDPNDFRFIALNGYYYEGLPGRCATAEGEVKVYGKMPYVEVTDGLFECE